MCLVDPPYLLFLQLDARRCQRRPAPGRSRPAELLQRTRVDSHGLLLSRQPSKPTDAHSAAGAATSAARGTTEVAEACEAKARGGGGDTTPWTCRRR